MDKKIKQTSSDQTYLPVQSLQKEILPLKRSFITFQSRYDYRSDIPSQAKQMLKENPKWCNLSLKLGHTGQYEEYLNLRRARSLRLRSVHLESYSLDSQGCGDHINRYFGELDPLTRAGHTLKKLSLSVTHDNYTPYGARAPKPNANYHLKKFVKKQKHLDEFGLYMGPQGNSKWMSHMLRYVQQTVKTLTIENMVVENIFKRYEFPKLETLRFEYMQFYRTENVLDFSVLRRSLQDILALPSLQTLVFSQYHRYEFEAYRYLVEEEEEEKDYEEKVKEEQEEEGERDIDWSEDEDESEENYQGDEVIDDEEERYIDGQLKQRLELVPIFWRKLRAELDKNKDKLLKIKYHKKDESNIQWEVDNFKEIFKGLPSGQTFEYEVAQASELSREEIKAKELEGKDDSWDFGNLYHYWTGVRYLISLDKVETI